MRTFTSRFDPGLEFDINFISATHGIQSNLGFVFNLTVKFHFKLVDFGSKCVFYFEITWNILDLGVKPYLELGIGLFI